MLGKRRKNHNVTYAIVGIGRFGHALAEELANSGCDLMILDKDEEKVREMRDFTENAFVVPSLDKKTLLETGIQNVDVAVVCIGEQMDTSILTTLNLVSFGIPLVIAKAKSLEHGIILDKIGAEVVYPERDMAIRLASRLETSRNLDFVQLSEKINVSKTIVPLKMIGKSILELDLRSNLNINIIAIENGSEVIEVIDPNYVLKENDILYLCGDKDGLLQFDDWANS